MRGLHGERHADAERRKRNHGRRPHADKHHLPEDRRELEELPLERCDQDPVKEARVEPEKVFQNAGARYNTAPPGISRLEVVLLLLLIMILLMIFPDGYASTQDQDQEHDQEQEQEGNQLA